MNYRKIYDQICQRAKTELEQRKLHKKSGGYYEGHHILPQALGGSGKSRNWDHENIVPLTAREHFLAHWLLVELYPKNRKLLYAFSMMCSSHNSNNRYRPSSRVVEYSRIQLSKMLIGSKLSDQHKANISLSNKGKHSDYVFTEDHRKKLGEKKKGNTFNKGRKHTDEVKKNMGNGMRGKKRSEESRKSQGQSILGEKNHMFGKRHTEESILKMKETKRLKKEEKCLNKITQ
jgi:hypothetical protein